MSANYDATTLTMIEPWKHQSLVDPLMQSGVITRNNYITSAFGVLCKVNLFGKSVRI